MEEVAAAADAAPTSVWTIGFSGIVVDVQADAQAPAGIDQQVMVSGSYTYNRYTIDSDADDQLGVYEHTAQGYVQITDAFAM